jgi:NRE family putative nickel resistance protein-like MFS transporter
MQILDPLKTLRERLFARLYIAQGISLIGDSITWVGIALLAYEFGGKESSKILATALTLRVTAFVLFGSYAGIIADTFSRKTIMIVTNSFRMIIVLSFAFVTAVWQLYILIFLLNIFNAFFSPAYKASIPQLISKKENYADAIALSNATWQVLGVAGPGLAGVLAAVWGSRQIFFVDAFSFLISSSIIFFIPISKVTDELKRFSFSIASAWNDMKTGTKLVFGNPPVRFALVVELASALAGAQVLVNTIGHIKGDLMLGDDEYGFIMAAFGAGATIAAFSSSTVDKSKNRTGLIISGALMIGTAVSFSNFVPFGVLTFLWVIAGLGLSYAEMPSQILIAENISKDQQGKAYGSHFAWTHVWWAMGYSFAGLTGTYFKGYEFLAGGLISVVFTIIVIIHRYRKSSQVRPHDPGF